MEKNVVIQLPKAPLLKVESITMAEEEIPFTNEGHRIILSALFWEKEISITYWAGYGETAASLPPDLKMAVLIVTRCFYDRQSVDATLLNPFKIFHLV